MHWLTGIGSFALSGVLGTLIWDALSTGVLVGKHGARISSSSPVYWLVLPLFVALALTFAWGGVVSIRKALDEQREDATPR